MATSKHADAAAAKAKKQKIILAAAGVAFLGLAVIQGPKLMKAGGSTPPPPAAEAAPATATAVSVATPSGGTATAVKVSKPGQTAVVAGVTISSGATTTSESSHLIAFSLFDAKDPFIPQGDDGTTSADSGSTTSTAATTPEPTASGGSSGAGTTTTAPKPPPVAYATIMLDGKPQQLQKKQTFPTGNPMFVLVALKKKQAKIGVAGGAFDDGKTITLVQGKKLTLVDTATGVRYELKLVYTGTEPEVIEGFSSGTTGASTSSSTPAPSASGGTTTAAPTP